MAHDSPEAVARETAGADLPSGTVTLLFSDMEGSTRLLSRLGDSYAALLDRQRHVLRQTWVEHAGHELGTEGDSFYVVFDTAPAAVRAAVTAQRRLAQEPAPADARPRVRIGIHTGSPVRHADAYVGMDVHRAARVAAAAHGGQVLVTEATARLVRESSITFKDLGHHRLKDLPESEHLLEVRAEGLTGSFPPVRSLGSTARLPVPPTPIVGRVRALDELRELVAASRLVTLTGPGGTGKTRLALEVAAAVAADFADGVYFTALENVKEADLMWTAIATSLDLPPEGRIPPGLFEHVAQSQGLIVLDNLEQLAGAPEVVSDLLREAPAVRVLATSRHPLHVESEQEFAVPPMELPGGSGDDPARSEAVQLFVAQARRVNSGFSLTEAALHDVVDLCRRLDGLPLALELAAARTKLLSVRALVARMDEALDLRHRDTGRPGRQQTLRQAIAWSYELLDEPHRLLFRSLAVFDSDVGLAAVAAVAESVGLHEGAVLDMVEELVDASLLTVATGSGSEPRVAMLNTVRAFAAEVLATSANEPAAHEAAANYYLQLMQDPRAFSESAADRRSHVAALEQELDNIRGVLGWLVGREDDWARTAALRIVATMSYRLWSHTGYQNEALRWCHTVCEEASNQADLALAECLLVWALLLHVQAQGGEKQLRAARTILDSMPKNTPTAGWSLEDLEGFALGLEADIARRAGDLTLARTLVAEALASASERNLRANFLVLLGLVQCDLGDHAEALERDLEAVEELTKVGDTADALSASLNCACELWHLGRLDEAHERLVAGFRQAVDERFPDLALVYAEHTAALLADLDRTADAGLIVGAAQDQRERNRLHRSPEEEADFEPPLNRARAQLGDAWDAFVAQGRELTLEQAMGRAGVRAG